jgi:hypothetical protein
LDKGTRITNRLIALMSSVSYPNLKNCAGELLFACFGGSIADFVAYIGYFNLRLTFRYGHAAGFLFERGIAIPGQENAHNGGMQSELDPISGRAGELLGEYQDEMTEEEKEVEAERLYHLIERLSATGIIKPVFQSS